MHKVAVADTSKTPRSMNIQMWSPCSKIKWDNKKASMADKLSHYHARHENIDSSNSKTDISICSRH